ncbi:FAS1-like dehydratase domain-containing protein [Halioglobus japonicus]|uniref:FAS1-like dehydratase domain-containing protein n=1 Tax=Halioglobus japonicus TaxID=930805 RepID=A0AAP8MI43_9GAMM|nr:MaoC family dehydratase N-terminal domain-containing protein [Halioglobus japonicus]PLW87829.1 hypothetical protein C0029_04455 [Halioglobus japonicus]
MSEDTLDRASLMGKRLGPYHSFNPVSRVQIWQWCSAMGDSNPLYLDREYHASHRIENAIAPPTMMQMWTMRDVNMRYAPGSTQAAPYRIFDDLTKAGYPANVAVSYDLEFLRYLQEGDRAHHYTTIVDISPLKETALGKGYFVTEQVEYLDTDDQPFAIARITYFQYQPRAEPASGTAAASSEPDQPAASSHTWQTDYRDITTAAVSEGQALPELTIPITHKLIVSGAVASQDFIDVHHNLGAAQDAAMPDIFMNILTTCGLSGRYLSDWAGPGGRLQTLRFKLMAPNTPGDTMVFQGRVSSVEADHVCVDFGGRNSRGYHVTGSATVRLADQ